MTFDVLLDQAGGQGRFQILQFIFIFISSALSYTHILLENFTAAIPDHRCWVHIIDNDTTSDNDTRLLSQEALLRISIPLDSNLKPDTCRRFIHPQWQLLHLNGNFSDITMPETEPCVDGWVYDQSLFFSTIVTKWDLVCEFKSLKYVAQTLFMVGSLLGSLICGYLTDRFGRKVIFSWCMLQLAIVNTCAALAPTFFTYCILRFLAGFSVMPVLSSSFILMVEWTVSQSLSKAITVMLTSYNTGQIFLGGLAFLIRNWQILQLILSIPLFIFFILSRSIAESTRWLIATDQLDVGLQELKRVARINGKQNAEEILTIEFVKSTMQTDLDTTRIKATVPQLFRSPELLKRTFFLGILRMAITVPLFSLMLNLEYLGSNIFLFQALFGAVMIISRSIGTLTLNHLGRRETQMLFFFLVGISILVNTFLSPEMQILRVSLATLGVGAISAGSVTLSIHSNELNPTTFRSILGGINMMFSRLGGVLTPSLMLLMEFSPHLPWMIYGLFPILAGLLVFCLPETRNKPHPNTIQDVENDTSNSRKQKQNETVMKVTQF